MLVKNVKDEVRRMSFGSAWKRGVQGYALGMLEDLDPDLDLRPGRTERALLNGAHDWGEYSWAGCALAYDEDIAKAVCVPGELARTRGGRLRPNEAEEWLDVQARACFQACELVKTVVEGEDGR